jgi:hypothetical protein
MVYFENNEMVSIGWGLSPVLHDWVYFRAAILDHESYPAG